MTDSPIPQPAEPPAKKPHAAQDQATANLINTCRTSLTAAGGHAALLALTGSRGYDAAGLAEGLAACNLAQDKFNARQIAMDNKRVAAKALKVADAAARTGYADFSRIAAKVFQDNPTAKAAVIIPARQIQDQDKFLTTVDGAYNTALARSTYLAALSKRGYTQAALQAEQAKLQALTQASAANEAALAAATRATTERNAAVKALKTWWAEFYATAQVALKDRPDLLGLLNA